MRLTSFLLGGIVGAAAVVYLSGRNKSMLWSALTTGNSLGNMMNQPNEKTGSNKNRMNDFSPFAASGSPSGNHSNHASNTGHSNKNGGNQDTVSTGSMYKVSEIVNQDPKLKSQVEQIMAGSSGKEEMQLQ